MKVLPFFVIFLLLGCKTNRPTKAVDNQDDVREQILSVLSKRSERLNNDYTKHLQELMKRADVAFHENKGNTSPDLQQLNQLNSINSETDVVSYIDKYFKSEFDYHLNSYLSDVEQLWRSHFYKIGLYENSGNVSVAEATIRTRVQRSRQNFTKGTMQGIYQLHVNARKLAKPNSSEQ